MFARQQELERVLELVSETHCRVHALNAHLADIDATLFDLNNRVSELVMRANGRNGYKAYTIPPARTDQLVST